jgi:dUTP pyrophosphatase
MNFKILKVCKNKEYATLPTRGSEYSAGLDFYSAYNYIIIPNGKEIINTEIRIELPKYAYGRLAGRSNFSWQTQTTVAAGVIDEDYTGVIKFLIFNHSKENVIIIQGQKIGQMIIEKIIYPIIMETTKEEMKATARGSKGLASEKGT